MMKMIIYVILFLWTANYSFAQDYTEMDFDRVYDSIFNDTSDAELQIQKLKPLQSSTEKSSFIRSTKQKQLKSGTNKAAQKQQHINRAFGLIKSFNQNTYAHNTIKIDSIVHYDPTSEAIYDSVLTSKEVQKFNEDSLVYENVIINYDSINGETRTKTEYEYNSNQKETESVTSNWDSITNTWINDRKVERAFDSMGKLTLFAIYDFEEGNWKPRFRNEFSYDQQGNRILSVYSTWNDLFNDLEKRGKFIREFNDSGNLTLETFYRGNESNEWVPHGKTEITYDYCITTTKYQWNTYTGQFEFMDEKLTWHDKYYDDNNNLTFESYKDEEIEWEKHYQYSNNNLVYERYNEEGVEWEKFYEDNNLMNEHYKSEDIQWERHYNYNSQGQQCLSLYSEFDGETSSFIEKEVHERFYSEEGFLMAHYYLAWVDTLNELKEVYSMRYVLSDDGLIDKRIVNGWNNGDYRYVWFYNYQIDKQLEIKQYSYTKTGYYTSYKIEDITLLNYDNEIDRITSISYKDANDENVAPDCIVEYDNNLKLISVLYPDFGEKIECFYDHLGRDSIWTTYQEGNGVLKKSNYCNFIYEIESDDTLKIQVNWFTPDNTTSEPYCKYEYCFKGNNI